MNNIETIYFWALIIVGGACLIAIILAFMSHL